jgi:hypothetical protein
MTALLRPGARRLRRVLLAGAGALAVCGCGPTRLTVHADIPPLLVQPMPLTMGVRIPKAFAGYVQKEKSGNDQWEIELGAAQSGAISRVMQAMFRHTVMLGDQAPGQGGAGAAELDGIVETTLDSYVYLLPSTAPGASAFFSATIGFKVDLKSPDGTVVGSWVYEGYGSAPERGLSQSEGVALVSGLAIRDACANLAVHLPEQELLRNLLTRESVPAPAPDQSPTPSSTTDQ